MALLRTRWIVLIALFGLVLVAGAASARLFWVANLPGYFATDVGTLTFTNNGPTPQNVSVANIAGTVYLATVPPGASLDFTMPDQITTSGIFPSGYRVTADNNILVTQFNPINNLYTNDAYRPLSLGEIGMDHWILTWNENTFPSFIGVVGTQAGTTVTVTPTTAIAAGPAGSGVGASPAGTPVSYTIGDRQLLMLLSNGMGDFSGSRVQSSAPVAVIAGHKCVNIGASACDHISEQVIPANRAGTLFPICSTVGAGSVRPGGTDRLRVIATAPGPTTVSQNTGPSATLAGPGSFVTWSINSDRVVSATQPVIVAQFYGDSNGDGDPAMIIHHNLTMHRDDQQIYTPPGGAMGWTDSIQVAAPSGTTTLLNSVPMGGWRAIGTTGWSCATSNGVPNGQHRVQSTNNVTVQVVGKNSYSSYWYLGDVGLEIPIVPPCHIDGIGPDAPSAFTAAETPVGSMAVFLDWGPPLNPGSCPIVGYEVIKQRGSDPPSLLATYSAMPPAVPQDFHWDSVTETCQDYRWAVRAWTNVSVGPYTPWRDLSWGGPPAAPSAELSLTPSGVALSWAPTSDGGCPITAFRVEGNSAYSGPLRQTVPASQLTMELEHDVCFAFTFQVYAINIKGASPWSVPARYTPAADLRYCSPQAPPEGDADGDGVVDAHDNCPFVKNAKQELAPDGNCPRGDVTEAVPEGLLPCTSGPGVDDVVAEPQADGRVLIRWQAERLCGEGRVTVWDNGRLIAHMPAADGQQTATDVAATAATHVYHVQVDAPASAILFAPAYGVPSNWIDLCSPMRLLAACPPPPEPTLPGAVANAPFEPHPLPPQQEAPGNDGRAVAGGLAWLVAAAVALAAVGGLVAWRRMQR